MAFLGNRVFPLGKDKKHGRCDYVVSANSIPSGMELVDGDRHFGRTHDASQHTWLLKKELKIWS